MKKSLLLEVIYVALDEVGKSLQQPLSKSPDTILFGKGGLLDSLELVNLIVTVEEELADRFEWDVALADERALSQKHSPFRTVDALADYIGLLAQEKEGEDV